MTAVIAAVIAGAIGAAIRFLVTKAFAARPVVAVVVVNIVGSALGGVLLGVATGDLRLIVLSGFCGGLTTFSTFGVETIQLILNGRSRIAIVSVFANLVLGIGVAALAYAAVVAR
ncbi:MAG: CrcB family protein [Salinibacterium sp.]|nr:CrcB family protein [Salinibacterium sp.]